MKNQVVYIAINPEGNACGPIGADPQIVREMLMRAFKTIGGSGKWRDISKQGYVIRKAEIILLEN